MTTMKRLRAAYEKDPCPKHKELCPIPKKGREMPCNWGHTAMEFADSCDPCAEIVLAALAGKLNYAQRRHHHKARVESSETGRKNQ